MQNNIHNRIKSLGSVAAASLLVLMCALPCAAEAMATSDTAAPIEANIPLDEAHFPDPVLRNALAEKDRDEDGILNRKEMEYFTSLWIDDSSLADVSGVELLPALTSLYVDNAVFTSVDLSGCQKLVNFSASGSGSLVELKLPPSIESVNISNCAISQPDLTNCPELRELSASGNKIESIDLTKCPELERLDLSGNKLIALDVSANPNLESLSLKENKLTQIDLTANTNLEELYLIDNKLTSIDITPCTELQNLYLDKNKLTGVDLSACPMLRRLSLRNNDIEGELTFDGAEDLQDVDVSRNRITALTINNCPVLNTLGCSSNRLTSLTLNDCPKLKYLFAYENKLEQVDASTCSGLRRANVSVDTECKVTYSDIIGQGIDFKMLWLIVRIVVGIGAAIAGIVWIVQRITRKARNIK